MAVKIANIKGQTGQTGSPGSVGPAGPTDVSSDSNNGLGLNADGIYCSGTQAAPPLATASANGSLNWLNGSNLYYFDATNNLQALKPQVTPLITAARAPYNALSNANFEVDQRTGGAGVALANSTASSGWCCDRWIAYKATAQTGAGTIVPTTGLVTDPSTGFPISNKFLRFTVTSAQAIAGATDQVLMCYSTIEGARLAPLMGAHSFQMLVRSSIPNWNFSIGFRNFSGGTSNYRSMTLLGTVTTANTWQLLQFPNLAVFDPTSTWNTTPGTYGYEILIALLSGTSLSSGQNNVWVGGNLYGAPGCGNFCANPVGSTFDIGFMQHEQGPVCTGLIDLPWEQNLRDCKRYYQKSWGYANATPDGNWRQLGKYIGSASIRCSIRFPEELHTNPTCTLYNASTGTPNTAYVDLQAPTAALTGAATGNASGINGAVTSTNYVLSPANMAVTVIGYWSADTGR